MSEQTVVKVTRRRTRKAVVADLQDGAAVAISEPGSIKADGATVIDTENRRQLVATEAYFFAERRGCAGGHEVGDWIAAERVVDSWLNQTVSFP